MTLKTQHGIIVKLFNKKKYGFIMGDDGSELFFHINGTISPFDDLREGVPVEYFVVGDRPRNGLKAIGVVSA